MSHPQNLSVVDQTEREIVLTRLINAPRELVFKVWTDPNHIIHWWGPTGFTNTLHEMEVKPGGVWRFIMHSPEGVDYDVEIVYREVVEPERLVYAHSSAIENDPVLFQSTITFEEAGEKTQLTMRMLFSSPESRNKMVELGAVEGGKSTLDSLEAYLEKM